MLSPYFIFSTNLFLFALWIQWKLLTFIFSLFTQGSSPAGNRTPILGSGNLRTIRCTTGPNGGVKLKTKSEKYGNVPKPT